MKKFSIIIPAYNERERIGDLLRSVQELDYPKKNYEVIVVNDGSTDDTREIVSKFDFVKAINLDKNQGRFMARKTGTENAKYENLFFIDSRSIVDPNALKVLNKNDKYKVMIGHSLGVSNPNAFETFYNAIRRFLFGDLSNSIIELDENNFDKYPKGTGNLFVKKDLWVYVMQSCKNIEKNMSDDTKLLFSLSQKEKIAINPELKIINFARKSFDKSLKHLFNRGIKFVDYYLDPRKRNFWLVIIFPPLTAIVLTILFVFLPVDIFVKLSVIAFLYFCITLYLAYNVRSFFKILSILPLIVITFYSGMIKGIFLKISNRESE